MLALKFMLAFVSLLLPTVTSKEHHILLQQNVNHVGRKSATVEERENVEEVKNDFETKVDEVVAALLECRDVISLSLAVVHNNQTMLTKAYGPANLVSGVNSTETTLFNIASLSKAFAATLLGAVLKESGGAYNWSTPVREILGDDFRFATDDMTQHATLRDLLAHRLGTPTHNDVRLRDDFSRTKTAQ